jgi:nicotinate-nucleotide adenylyltransferase
MNIGIFGGSFDPIHIGHLLFAQQMLDLVPLDKVVFVPAQNQYMKSSHKASFHDRCQMVSKAIDGNPRFDMEVIQEEGNTYTYNTLKILKEKRPDDQLFFLAGDDTIDHLEKWHRIEEIGTFCTMVFGTRDSDTSNATTTSRYLKLDTLSKKHNLPYVIISAEVEFGVSSTYVRRRIVEYQPITYLVPEKVIDYIYSNGLYKE